MRGAGLTIANLVHARACLKIAHCCIHSYSAARALIFSRRYIHVCIISAPLQQHSLMFRGESRRAAAAPAAPQDRAGTRGPARYILPRSDATCIYVYAASCVYCIRIASHCDVHQWQDLSKAPFMPRLRCVRISNLRCSSRV